MRTHSPNCAFNRGTEEWNYHPVPENTVCEVGRPIPRFAPLALVDGILGRPVLIWCAADVRLDESEGAVGNFGGDVAGKKPGR